MNNLLDIFYAPKTLLLNQNNNINKFFEQTKWEHSIAPRQHVVGKFSTFAGRNPLKSVFKKCNTCKGQGAVDCAGCKGTGRNKKNGNIFERWKCYDCQGFGLRSCPECGKGGLTPEQRGER